jgi:hypothetical protein
MRHFYIKIASYNIKMCITRVSNIEVKILEQIHNLLAELRMLTGVEMLGLEGGWKETGRGLEAFVKEYSRCQVLQEATPVPEN